MAAQGVGKKIAQRIILELKDKLAKETETISFADGVSVPAPLVLDDSRKNDAAAALAVLGFSSAEINAALRSMDVENLSTEAIVKNALKQMSRS